MRCFCHGLEYYIITDKPIDYFDLVPTVEGQSHMRIELDGVKIKMITMRNSDERLLESQYYSERKAEWFSGDKCHFKIEGDTQPIVLSDAEKNLQNVIIEQVEKIGRTILAEGWYDVAYYY